MGAWQIKTCRYTEYYIFTQLDQNYELASIPHDSYEFSQKSVDEKSNKLSYFRKFRLDLTTLKYYIFMIFQGSVNSMRQFNPPYSFVKLIQLFVEKLEGSSSNDRADMKIHLIY